VIGDVILTDVRDITFTSINFSIPEPTGLTLACVCLGGLAVRT
jgi:hypothetical protein